MTGAHVTQTFGRSPVATDPRRFLQPRRWAFWLYAALALVAGVSLAYDIAGSARGSPAIMGWLMMSLLIWALWALALGWLIGRIDRERVVSIGVRLAALAGGALCLSYSGRGIALLHNLTANAPQSWQPALDAPLPEEAAKYGVVLLLAGIVPAALSRPAGAVLCGALCGLGFSFREDWYMTGGALVEADSSGESQSQAALNVFLYRGLIGAPWAHATFAALAAVGVWYYLAHSDRSRAQRIWVAVAFFLGALLLHTWANAGDALGVGSTLLSWLFTLTLLVVLIIWARRTERASVPAPPASSP